LEQKVDERTEALVFANKQMKENQIMIEM